MLLLFWLSHCTPGERLDSPYIFTIYYANLIRWMNGERSWSMPYAVPMIWPKPISHLREDCYFWLTKVQGLSKIKSNIVFSFLPSAIRLILHRRRLPVTKPSMNLELISLKRKQLRKLKRQHHFTRPSFHFMRGQLISSNRRNLTI